MKTLEDVYRNHLEMPYIHPKYETDLLEKPIAKKQMIRTKEGLLPGHIILLWRIQFGTYLTNTPHHKYFYTTYGIDAEAELELLIAEGYVKIDSAFDSLRHLGMPKLRQLLMEKGVKGLSKMNREALDREMALHYSEEELASCFDFRSYALLPKGEALLMTHSEIVAGHPQKKY